MRILISLFLIASLTGVVFADAGENALQFLRIGMGAEASAVGGAYSAAARGVNAVYWNPAGLSGIEMNEVQFNHMNMLGDINQTYIAYATPSRFGSLGFSYSQLNSGEVDKTTINTANLLPVSQGTTNMKDVAFAVSYGNKHSELLSYGCSLKFVQEDIAGVNEKTF